MIYVLNRENSLLNRENCEIYRMIYDLKRHLIDKDVIYDDIIGENGFSSDKSHDLQENYRINMHL